MARNARSVRLLVLILAIGVLMRLSLVAINPPNNSYDDHLQPIALYAETGERPAPDECWQCYQPPAYYALSAAVLTVTHSITSSVRAAWEAVQWVSAFASVGTLILCMLLVRSYLPETPMAQLGALLFLIALPRDLYTAASVGNDALLTFFVTATVFCFARLHTGQDRTAYLIGLAIFSVLAAWTKQSGLVALVLVGFVGLDVWQERNENVSRWGILGGLVLVCLIALADEAWRTYQTGIPLASNQHFEYRAQLQQQAPGHISASTFTTFLPIPLLEHTTLHPSTIDSFWTQMFARTWFDYEPRFLPRGTETLWVSRSFYVVGFGATLILLAGLIRIIRKGPASARKLLLVPAGFLAGAMLQTLRFPHFSSMKALFILPAVGVFALCFGYGVQMIQSKKWGRQLMISVVFALLLIGSVHWLATLLLNAEALNSPTSPLWPFPQV